MNVIADYKLPEGCSLGLKVVLPGGRPEVITGFESYLWSLTLGGVSPICKEEVQLFVWEWAQGDLSLSNIWDKPDMIWLAVEYDTESAVVDYDSTDILKCRTIAVSLDRYEVVSFIQAHTPPGKRYPVLFGKQTVEEGDVEVGDGGIAIVRGKGAATAGKDGWASCGDGGRAIAGKWGTARAGKGGYALVGVGGVAIAGEGGRASVGYGGMACVGEGGELRICCSWIANDALALKAGADNIKPNTFYRIGYQELVAIPHDRIIQNPHKEIVTFL